MSDLYCLSGQNVRIRQCENDDDLCYSWFHRTGKKKFLFYIIYSFFD
jgi:hypothetical protein